MGNNKLNVLLCITNKILDWTNYELNKNIISEIFNKQENSTLLKLTIIDSFYSTNMSKRYFWLEDLNKFINDILEKEDYNDSKSFLKNHLKEIVNTKIWIQKNTKKSWHALSLITKYFYFKTNFNFPIYDNLIFEELKYYYPNDKIEKYGLKYFEKLNELKNDLEWNDNKKIDNLDKILWLSWKIRKWSFGLIVKDKEEYKEIINELYKNENIENLNKRDDKLETLIVEKLEKIDIKKVQNNKLKLIVDFFQNIPKI